jgi:hypothetical protein
MTGLVYSCWGAAASSCVLTAMMEKLQASTLQMQQFHQQQLLAAFL